MAWANCIASSTVRQPVRPPGTPISSSAFNGRTRPFRSAWASISFNCGIESTRKCSSRSGVASFSCIACRMSSRPTSWLARMMRRKPTRTPRLTCCIVANVMPQAPDSICRANSCGAIVVLPCGASNTPVARVKSAIHSRLCASADSFSSATGNGRSPRSTFQPRPPMSLTAHGDARCGYPFSPASSIEASIAVMSIMSGHPPGDGAFASGV